MNNKKLLVLGGNYSTVGVVNYAHEMGLYVIVTSNQPTGEAKDIADEAIQINVTDHDAIIDYIKKNNIDGVMTGASEFHLLNMIRICAKAGIPCYATEKQWNICQNKQSFKQLCRDNGVPSVQQYQMADDPSSFDYPIIVKPTDGCSARGISVCQNADEYNTALSKALEYSAEKKVVIEKFMENKGTTMSVKYIAINGELYLEAVGDRYVLDSNKGKALITAAAFYPSKYTDKYIQEVDEKVKNMYKNIGLKDGVLFMEAIANDDGIWFYEMGLRVSGGMTYKITEKTNGINELKMLINHATAGIMCEDEDIKKIDPHLNGYYSASLCLPLTVGQIGSVKGMDVVKALPEVGHVTEYWEEGGVIEQKHIGTLDQLFARIPIIVKGKDRLAEIIRIMKENVSVRNVEGEEMVIWSKLDEIYDNYMEA